MNRNITPPDDSWESDAVWQLLDQAAPKAASARFADDVVRAARLAGEVKPWWSRLLSPAPLAGLAAATAALAFSAFSLFGPSAGTYVDVPDSPQAANIQEIAETETLIAAVDHLDDFSDTELVSLIGF
ncbi:MAG: hypothetical protein ABIT37_17530 [Luteolibacter sp.]